MEHDDLLTVQRRLRKFTATVALISFSTCIVAQTNFTGATIHSEVRPSPRANSEFYSAKPDTKLLIPVHIWGEVKIGGLYYLTPGSTVEEAISESGGPLTSASLSSVRIQRQSGMEKINLLEQGKELKINSNEVIYVDRSFKADIPIVFGGVSVLVSLATLAIMLTKL